MPDRFSNLTGFILAGGKSQRMGQPKQRLILGGETQISREARVMGSVCGRVAVIGSFQPERFKGLEKPGILSAPRGEDVLVSYEDALPGCGPLGGIYSGLLRTRTEYNLFAGCDMPFLTPSFLRFVCQRALACRADVTVPESADHRFQRLCAVYRRRARAAIRSYLARDGNKISGFYPSVRCEVIRWSEIVRAGFKADTFTNMNTPEDYVAVRKILGG